MARSPEPITPAFLRSTPLPEPGASKRERGDVLVVGGARKTPGAVILSGAGALRVGAGRLTLAVAESVATATAVSFPEAGVIGLTETESGAVAASSADLLTDDLDVDCLVVGPGLDDADEATELLRRLIPNIGEETTVLLDAFALGSLAKDRSLGDAVRGRLVLTPNETEAGLLLGRDVGELVDDVPEIARIYGAVVTCHGFVADPDGGLWEVTTGHPGLATSGSGDVLAGAIAGLAARGTDTALATCWASYLHAAAGDRLSARVGPIGFFARELLDELPPLLAELA